MSEEVEIRPERKWYEPLKNKYLIVSVFFLVWVGFFDQNNLIDRFRYLREVRQLEEARTYYNKQIREVNAKLYELNHQKQDLEKFAREEHLMKKDNEDVFVISPN